MNRGQQQQRGAKGRSAIVELGKPRGAMDALRSQKEREGKKKEQKTCYEQGTTSGMLPACLPHFREAGWR